VAPSRSDLRYLEKGTRGEDREEEREGGHAHVDYLMSEPCLRLCRSSPRVPRIPIASIL
jgi:hypothetical protein